MYTDYTPFMSASDYIQLKRIKTRLGYQHLDTLNPVLSSRDYTDFVGYGIESTVVNTLMTPSQLALPDGFVTILNMDQPSVVPSFPVCHPNLYQERWNRVMNPPLNCSSLYSRPLSKKEKDKAQCRTGCPQRTTLQGRPLQWPGDNRIKQTFREAWNGTPVYSTGA